VGCWAEKGVQGHLVFKYRLKRLEGQPPLTTSQVLFTRGNVPMPISELPGCVAQLLIISILQSTIQISQFNLLL